MNEVLFGTLNKLACIVLLIGSLCVVGLFWHHSIVLENDEKWRHKLDQQNIIAQQNLKQMNYQVSFHQAELNAAQASIIQKSKELEDAKAAYDNLRGEYASGALRLSVAPTHSQSGGAKQDTDSSIAVGIGQDRPIEFMPEVATTILDVARQNRNDVRLKNTCIDLYNAAIKQVNSE